MSSAHAAHTDAQSSPTHSSTAAPTCRRFGSLWVPILVWSLLAIAAQGATTPPLSYRAVTDRIPRPRPALPQLGAAGSTFVDPTFGARLIRVTDPNVGPGFAPMSYVTMASGNNTTWNADSTKFIVFLLNGYSAIYQFDPSAFTTTLMMDSNKPGQFFYPRGFQMFSFAD